MNYLRTIITIVVTSTLLVPVHVALAQAAPYAQTFAPTFLTERSARLNGHVSGNQMIDTRTWFEWGLANDQTHYVETTRRTTGTFVGALTVDIAGLAPDTEYVVRLMAENSRGKFVGNTVYFHTKPLVISGGVTVIVKTLDPTFVDRTSVKLEGYAAPSGSTDGKVWFAWGKTTATTNETARNSVGGTSHAYTYALNGLEPGTIYFYRAVGINSAGRTQGEIKWFLTLGEAPKATSSTASGNTGSSGSNGEVLGATTGSAGVISNIKVIPEHNVAVITFHYGGVSDFSRASIEWGPTSDLGKKADLLTIKGAGDVRAVIGTLRPCTTYYYRVVITQDDLRSVSAVNSLTTNPSVGSSCGIATAAGAGTETANNGEGAPTSGTAAVAQPGLGWKPAPIFGIPFPGTRSSTEASSSTSGAGQMYGSERNGGSTPRTGVAGFLDRLFGGGAATTANKPLTVTIVPQGDGGPHTPVEYRISYVYKGTTPLQGASLKVILPQDVVYIGDDTTNELLLEDNPGDPEHTYVLPIGTLDPGESRTITMLGMTTSDAKNVPLARARVEYVDPSGSGIGVVSSGGSDASAQTAATANASGSPGILPSSFLGWFFFVLLVLMVVLGVRFARSYYEQRKAELDAEKRNDDAADEHMPFFSSPQPFELARENVREEPDPRTGLTSALFAQLPQ